MKIEKSQNQFISFCIDPQKFEIVLFRHLDVCNKHILLVSSELYIPLVTKCLLLVHIFS